MIPNALRPSVVSSRRLPSMAARSVVTPWRSRTDSGTNRSCRPSGSVTGTRPVFSDALSERTSSVRSARGGIEAICWGSSAWATHAAARTHEATDRRESTLRMAGTMVIGHNRSNRSREGLPRGRGLSTLRARLGGEVDLRHDSCPASQEFEQSARTSAAGFRLCAGFRLGSAYFRIRLCLGLRLRLRLHLHLHLRLHLRLRLRLRLGIRLGF